MKIYLQPWQRELVTSTARIRVACCGRKSGKTYILPIDQVVRGQEGCKRIWYVSPAMDQTNEIWARWHEPEMTRFIRRERKSPRIIETKHGAQISFKTAGTKENLRSAGLDVLYIDEAAFLDKMIYEAVLLPMLTTSAFGKVVLTSTPNGFNWFYSKYTDIGDSVSSRSWHKTSYDNPYANREFIEEQRRTLPDLVFRQEYLAEFVADANAAFQNVDQCVVDDILPGSQTVSCGIDLGKHNDYTVLTFINPDGVVLGMTRFHSVSWPMCVELIKKEIAIWKPKITTVDTTGVGDPVADMLAQHVSFYRFTFTSKSKPALIEALIAAVHDKQIKIQRSLPVVLLSEMKALRFKRRMDGSFTYEAPSGAHDDCVMSLALAWHGYHAGLQALNGTRLSPVVSSYF